jgi:chitinase
MKKLLIVLLGIVGLMSASLLFAGKTEKINAVYWCSWGGNTSFNLGTDYLPSGDNIVSIKNGELVNNGTNIKTEPVALDQIPADYNVIIVSFLIQHDGEFVLQNFNIDPTTKEKVPGPWSYDDIKKFIGKAHSKGQKVTVSLGGAIGNTAITDDNVDNFITQTETIISEFKFDGLDLDLESGAVSASSPEAIKKALLHFRERFGNEFILSMIPEFPEVKTNSVYGKLLQDTEIDFTYVGLQYYNQYGEGINTDNAIFGSWYVSASSAKNNLPLFISAVTWAFATPEGNSMNQFPYIPANKLVIGLPSAVGAAGNMSTNENIRKQAYEKTLEILRVTGSEYQGIGGFANWSADFDNLIMTGKDENGLLNHPQWAFGKSIKKLLSDNTNYNEI